MESISLELSLIYNLYNTAKQHKKHCHTHDCNVSLSQLKTTAKYLLKAIHDSSEYSKASDMLNELGIWY